MSLDKQYCQAIKNNNKRRRNNVLFWGVSAIFFVSMGMIASLMGGQNAMFVCGVAIAICLIALFTAGSYFEWTEHRIRRVHFNSWCYYKGINEDFQKFDWVEYLLKELKE